MCEEFMCEKIPQLESRALPLARLFHSTPAAKALLAILYLWRGLRALGS
jgi:hypothetical protein